MDGIYLPDGYQLALIDRHWILDELPHLGNPDDHSDAHHLLASAAAANSGSAAAQGSSVARATSSVGASTGVPAHGAAAHTGAGDSTGANGSTTVNHHSLLYSPDESEDDLALLSEIVDETQSKWSDFGLNQLVTPYARTVPRIPK